MPVSGAPLPGQQHSPRRGGRSVPRRAEEYSDRQSPVQGSKHDHRLPRALRIARSAVFKEAFDGGVKHVGKFMVMWLRSGDDAGLRLGVVASKRTFRRAVDRARAKRMLREAYRLNRFRLVGDCDVILVARHRILDAHLGDIQEELLALARKGKILGN